MTLGKKGQSDFIYMDVTTCAAFQKVDPVWADEESYSAAAEISGKGDPR